MNHPTVARIVIVSVFFLALAVLAVCNGYFRARSLPIRFHGEKLLISVLLGGLLTFSLYGFERLEGSPTHPEHLWQLFGFFLLSGASAEVTVHLRAGRSRNG